MPVHKDENKIEYSEENNNIWWGELFFFPQGTSSTELI
jgi:hypothetical protein